MHSGYHLADRLLEDTMGRWIGDHTTGQHLFVLLGFRFPIRQIGIAQLVALHHAGFKTGLYTGSGVRSVCRSRDKKDFALALVLALEVFANNDQTRVFTCRTRSGLKRAGIETGNGA